MGQGQGRGRKIYGFFTIDYQKPAIFLTARQYPRGNSPGWAVKRLCGMDAALTRPRNFPIPAYGLLEKSDFQYDHENRKTFSRGFLPPAPAQRPPPVS